MRGYLRLPPCLIGIEACGSAHYWARTFTAMGHTVKIMSPQFVKPYVKSNKNDAVDAEAICEAVGRPHMRFVPVKDGDGGGLDGDAAFALEVHGVEHLGFHLARLEGAGQFKEAVGERRLAMVDMRDDGEVADE